jgi:Icc-related predicted phosphoesterase
MKILLTSDLHLSLPWFEWLIAKSPAFNLVCIAGDFLDLFSKEPKANMSHKCKTIFETLPSRQTSRSAQETMILLVLSRQHHVGRPIPGSSNWTIYQVLSLTARHALLVSLL